MINLRYHIVSLTAVFLAIGIGLTLGSTFLDRATVDNLNGQLESLEGRLRDREERIQDLEERVSTQDQRQAALDAQASGLLSGELDSVPVLVVGARGIDEEDIQQMVSTLVVADADVKGIWWLTERWSLEDEGAVSDLAAALDVESTDPSLLRRTAITELGGELRARQRLRAAEEPVEETVEETVEEPVGGGSGDAGAEPAPDGGASGDDTTDDAETVPNGIGDEGEIVLVDTLVDAGFVEFEAVSGGPDTPRFPDGTRIVFGAGSSDVPDDLVLQPLLERMVRASDEPVLGIVGSARPGNGELADAVVVIREDETRRNLVPTVDRFEHFEGWAAGVLALVEVADGLVGHYGIDETASRLLPPVRAP